MKPRNPDVDFGFFAQIPRMIRTDYKSLTSVQKWLYVCLKDLCGETGTCYRTLRVLAEETSISTGMLSESIAALHKEGLIHAEKKKRSIGGKEVWHITIVDIWQANAKAHPTKRSHSEQTIENVHSVNNNVHHVNDNTPECSHSEPECSHSETEVISSEAISFNEAISLEERDVATATARSQFSSSSQETQDDEETEKREAIKPSQNDAVKVYSWTLGPVLRPMTLNFENIDTEKLPIITPSQKEAQHGQNQSHTRNPSDSSESHFHSNGHNRPLDASSPLLKDVAQHGTPANPAPGSTTMGNARNSGSSRTQRQKADAVTPPPVSPEAQRILDDWVSLFTKKIVINQGDIDAAEHLVPTNITREDMRQERLWLFSTDNPKKPWYRKIGVCLADIDKKYAQWQSLQEAPPAPLDKSESNEYRVVSSFGTPGYNFADEFYPSEKEKKAYYAAQAAQQGVKA